MQTLNYRRNKLQISLLNDTRSYCEIGQEYCPDLSKRKMAFVSEIIVMGLAVFHLIKELFQVTQVKNQMYFESILYHSFLSFCESLNFVFSESFTGAKFSVGKIKVFERNTLLEMHYQF